MVNKTFDWVIRNCPPSKHDARFFPYGYVHIEAYGFVSQIAGNVIREDLQDHIYDLCRNYNIAVQLGAKQCGERGIRLMSVK